MTDAQLNALGKYLLIISLTALLAGGYEWQQQLLSGAFDPNAIARAMLAPMLTGIATSLLPSLRGEKQTPSRASEVDVKAMNPKQRAALARKLKAEMMEQP